MTTKDVCPAAVRPTPVQVARPMRDRRRVRVLVGLGITALATITTGCTRDTTATTAPPSPPASSPTTSTPAPVSAHRPSPTRRSPVVPACAVTPVRSDPLPAAVPGFVPGATGPWMGSDDFVAYLFYPLATTDPTMRAGGRMSAGMATKVFWWVRSGGDTLVIRGVEATSGRTFTQTVVGIGAGQFPSVPVLPGAGCWTLTESIAGKTVGAITIPVTTALTS